jgi:hypothetical protein
VAEVPVDSPSHHRPVRAAPVLDGGRAVVDERRARSAREDALLLLRQQCGIQLKVRDNEVIGFEPWEDFPFNRGMLCPKG